MLTSAKLYFICGLPPFLFLISVWSPTIVNISNSSTLCFLLPMTPFPWIPSLLSSSHPLLLLFYCKTSKCCFPEILLREELLSVLFIRILAAIHSFFYVKRGGQLHSDEIWSMVFWFRASFCSTPMIICFLFSFFFFLWGKFRLYPEPFYREWNQKKIWPSKKEDNVAARGTH